MNTLLDNKRSWHLLPLLCCLLLCGQTTWAAPHNHPQGAEHNHTESMSGNTTSQFDDNHFYSCPMHPEETSHQPGRCSVCGMFLQQQKQQPQQLYACPMHPEETSHQPGRCSVCGMFLQQQQPAVKQHKQQKGMHSDQMQHESAMPQKQHPTTTSSEMKPVAMGHEMPANMGMLNNPKPKRFWETVHSHPAKIEHHHQVDKDSMFATAKRLAPSPSSNTDLDPAPVNHEGDSHTHSNSTYVCPMHPQITSQDADASCPICGMDLVEKSIPASTYICPMHPQIVAEEAGSCPICGMDLVAKSSASKQDGEPQVFLPSHVIQNMGIRTAKAVRGSVNKSVRTQGIVTADDDRIHNIHPRTGGWVERLYPTTEGDRVERKEELVDFYSPWINQVQLEFIAALEEYDLITYDPTRKTELDAKVDALRNRLRLLNVPPMELMRIEKSRKVLSTIQIKAPQGGWITDLNVTEGTFVEPYEAMFTIVDLSEVWIMVDIFEHQAPWVRKGQEVTITTATIPGRVWTGKVDFIYPEVNPKTRTLRARIEVPNPDEALLLNMFVQVELFQGAPNNQAITVPRESIIVTGERELVVRSLGKGHFQPTEITSGLWGDGRVEILAGVEAGDEIVVSGQFLIDSESNIQSSLLRMME